MRLLIATLGVVLSMVVAAPSAQAASAVPTFECVGLYWSPAGGSSATTCAVRYRVGTQAWRDAMPLWFDAVIGEYRGSIVNLTPGTTYEISLSLQGTTTSTTLSATTWSEHFPVASTTYLPNGTTNQSYAITGSGTPGGYALYTFPPAGSTTIDVANAQDNCVTVNASYVILRGLTLKGAARDAILLAIGVHDVIVEGCDISGWGRIAPDGFGEDMDAAVKGGNWNQFDVGRIVVQRNRMHHPRSNSNDWGQYRAYIGTAHPEGPQAVVLFDSPGSNVFRYNEVYSDSSHRFNDGFGGAYNFSAGGYPGPDSDIYGNLVTHVCDDALEIEGGGRNVRVWGNYLEETFTGISTTICSVGPVYIFRNVLGKTRETDAAAGSGPGVLGKLGDDYYAGNGVGQQYWIHNTVLQPAVGGANRALCSYGGPFTRCMSINNIFQSSGGASIEASNTSPTNNFDYDLYNAEIRAYPGAEPHGINGMPTYAAGNGALSGSGGMYQLAPASPGYDAAMRLPNFNDAYTGAGPDIGAHESGSGRMEFGVNAYAGGGPAIDVAPPSAPGGLTASVASSSRIDLSWTASTDNVAVSGYRVYRDGAQIGTAAGTSYASTGLAAGTTYTYSVVAFDAAGNLSGPSAGAGATTSSLSQPPAITSQPADVTTTTGQTATFSVVAAGAAPLVYQWQRNGADIVGASSASYTTPPTTIADSGSQFRVVVGNAAGAIASASAKLTVTSVSPPTDPGDGLQATYFDALNFSGASLSRVDPTIDFDWGTGSPDPAIAPDTFSVTWTGWVLPEFSERYTFTTLSDDGIRIWVNGKRIIRNWTDHLPTENSGTITLRAGVKVPIRIEYYDRSNGATARLSWSSPSRAKQVVPKARLFSGASAPASAPVAPAGNG